MKYRCAVCQAVRECKHTFGKYWAEKSSNGTGCNYPVKPYLPAKPLPPPTRPRRLKQGDLV